MHAALSSGLTVVRAAFVFALMCITVACQGEPVPLPEGRSGVSPSRPHAEWTRDAVIYEVNVRQFTPEGTFAALQRELPRLAELGVDVLWLMPVQPIGVAQRKGSLGSYYAIADYRAINPEHGTQADARAFIDAAHALGLKVILDWVANHTAFDHVWTQSHPEWYTKTATGEISVALDDQGRVTDWTDVAELDYGNAEMRQAMIEDMTWWLTVMNIDGFRCDVAGGVPDDFWATADSALTAVRPDLFLLAEAEGPRFHASFDATYAWEMHHILNRVSTGEGDASELRVYFARQDSLYPADAYRLAFTSNHDENSWQGTEFERMGANHLPSFVLAATAARSMPLLYTGQERSFNRRLRFFDKDSVDWTGASLETFYRRVFALRDSVPAVRNGSAGADMVVLATEDAQAFAFSRADDVSGLVVVVNFADAATIVGYRGLVAIGTYRDWFSGESVSLASDGTLPVPANGYRVLVR